MDDVLNQFEELQTLTGSVCSWLTGRHSQAIVERLGSLPTNPLTGSQFNQLLVLGHEAPMSEGFFRYYWLCAGSTHPYQVIAMPGAPPELTSGGEAVAIGSVSQLKWGFYRLYVDGLLWFGNVRAAFRHLRGLSFDDLVNFFSQRRFDSEALRKRGRPLPLRDIAKEDRYLISEMASASYGIDPRTRGDLSDTLLEQFSKQRASGQSSPTVRSLLEGSASGPRQGEFLFAADEVLDDRVVSEDELGRKIDAIAERFNATRAAALENTGLYLSMASDLDVYVATSMRNRTDFGKMATFCEQVFADERLKRLHLRYFDPTLSAATDPENKGLLECLMVKCAKALVYCAGQRDSFGKDAEAAMALSLGKPVIFYCDEAQRGRFYREVHPLSRLIHFETGVAVGAMVTDRQEDVAELLSRLFENRMEYRLELGGSGNLRLRETLTDSVVRLQTGDSLLNETFWNHYHRKVSQS